MWRALALSLCLSAVGGLGCVPTGGGDDGSGGSGGSAGAAGAAGGGGEACSPDCTNRVCGSDGCDGICGTCDEAEVCTAAGECLEIPATCGDGACSAADGESCETCPADCGMCCGDGACTVEQGETCATCPADCGCVDGEVCDAAGGVCGPACVPDCDGRVCGPDGCEGRCGDCADGEVCSGDGTCAPPPEDCGDGRCSEGEDCANCAADCGCPEGQDCAAGACVDRPRCGDAACGEGEDCASCPADCGCPEGQDCAAGVCVDPPTCGDGACGEGEDCARCAADCGCPGMQDCVEGVCVDGPRCGDGVCDPAEDCGRCPNDCGCQGAEACVDGACRCLPQCDGRACGPDGCGGSCGACPDGSECADGQCAVNCVDDCGEPWVAACTGDGFGYRLCAPDPERPGCTAPSRRVPCGEERACDNAGDQCVGPCVRPEVMLLVDRSSSMQGDRWQFTRDTLIGNADDRRDLARLGLRTFPSEGDGCRAGPIAPPGFNARAAFQGMPAPDQIAQTPIAAAFDEIEATFGDPDEGESVVLITDGDETCEDEFAAVERARALRARGVRTFVIGISRQANGELLAAIAEAGGTARANGSAYYVVADRLELRAALADIFGRLEACVCEGGESRCNGDSLEICGADGYGFVEEAACDLGCDAVAGQCHPVCNPADGTLGCEGDTTVRCAARGDGFDPVEACPFGCQPIAGCNPTCRPGARRCNGDVSELCDEAGDAWAAVENCALCEPETGECGEPPPPMDVPLDVRTCWARHGSCNSWNECVNAEGCANLACAAAGHGPAVSWVESNECRAAPNCLAFHDDEERTSVPICELPAACQVVCSPAP